MEIAPGFMAQPNRCWRMIRDPAPGRGGQPLHCPEPTVYRGRYRSSEGKTWTVWACREHRDGLEDVTRLQR